MSAVVDAFSSHIETVARHFWGDPNPRLSVRNELRWGNHGSRSVDLDKGVWFDNEAKEGGGVLDLVARETRFKGGEAVGFLRERLGVDIPDERSSGGFGAARAPKRSIAATYDYTDENGDLLFQVVRFDPKDFRQRRPDQSARDGWNWSIKGVRQVLYRLPEVIEAVALGQRVFIVEGEKDADRLWKAGLAATCNAGGAGKWPEGLSASLCDAEVVIIPDNDEAGRGHVALVGAALQGVAASVKVLELPDLPNKGDVSNWLADGHEPAELFLLSETEAKAWSPGLPGPPESLFGAIQWGDLDSVTIRQDWLVEDMLFQGDSGLIFGASGSGKSFLAVDMALAIARGVPFLGKATRQGAVLYQAGEGGNGLVKRLKAYRQHYTVVAEVPLILLPARVDLFGPEGDRDAFLEECKAWKAHRPDLAVLFIDTLSTASPGANENASEDMSRLLAFSDAVQREVGIAVIWVHHKNATGERERGHTSLRSNVDTAWEVNRDQEEPDYRTVKLVKIKDGEDGEVLGFELQSVKIGTYDSGKPMTSCVIRPAEVGSPRTGREPKLANGQHLFMTCLDDAIAQRGGVLPPDAGAPSGTYGVDWDTFRTIYKAVKGSGLDDGAVRQALKREGEAMLSKGYAGRSHPWIWLTKAGSDYLTRYRR